MVVGTAEAIVMIESGAKGSKGRTVSTRLSSRTPRNQENLRRDRRASPQGGKPKRA